MSDIKKIFQSAKESYDSVVKENIELKKYAENIKARQQEYQNREQQREYLARERVHYM